MADDCGICKIRLKRNEIKLHCTGNCKKVFHLECAKMKVEEFQILHGNKNMKWFCDNCISNFDFMAKVYNDISSFKETMMEELSKVKDLIQTKEDKVVEQNEFKRSYADVAGEVMVIKPKTKQECQKTKQVLCENLNPSKLGVGIKQIKEIKDGGILIKCDTKEEIRKMKNEADKKLKDGYSIKMPETKNPKIKIVDINEQMSEETILSCIISQNDFLNHDDQYFKVVTSKRMKTKFMAIIECDPLSFSLLINKGRICVGWSVCRVFEYIPILRCYKCGVFDHKASECQSEEKCLKCAKVDHVTRDCVSEHLVCSNCCEVNDRFKLNLKTDHSNFDINCPSYQKKITTKRRKIKTLK